MEGGSFLLSPGSSVPGRGSWARGDITSLHLHLPPSPHLSCVLCNRPIPISPARQGPPPPGTLKAGGRVSTCMCAGGGGGLRLSGHTKEEAQAPEDPLWSG